MNKEALKKYTKNLKADLALSRVDIEKQMSRQAGLYSYYATGLSKAIRDEKRSKLRLEMRETQVYRRLSDQHSRVTEKMLLTECCLDKNWLRLRQFLDANSYAADRLKGACQALIHKKDMLVNLGATLRTEMAGEVFTSKP